MPNKKRRDTERQVNIDLPAELDQELSAFCEVTAMKKKALIELAIRRLLNDQAEVLRGL